MGERERCVDNTSVTSRIPHHSCPRLPKRVQFVCASHDRHRLKIPSMSFVSFNNIPNSSANVLAIKQQQPPPVVDLDVLQAASRVLQEQLLKDTQIIPDHGEMFAYSAYLHFHLVRPSFPYPQQLEALASTAFSQMIIEYRFSRENSRASQRVCSSILLVRDHSISLVATS